jgi:hypothetical protein
MTAEKPRDRANENLPADGLRGAHETHPEDLRDTKGGTYDALPGERDAEQVREHRTAHEDAQSGADVRAMPEGERNTLPEGLVRRTGPMNKTTGRRPINDQD